MFAVNGRQPLRYDRRSLHVLTHTESACPLDTGSPWISPSNLCRPGMTERTVAKSMRSVSVTTSNTRSTTLAKSRSAIRSVSRLLTLAPVSGQPCCVNQRMRPTVSNSRTHLTKASYDSSTCPMLLYSVRWLSFFAFGSRPYPNIGNSAFDTYYFGCDA